MNMPNGKKGRRNNNNRYNNNSQFNRQNYEGREKHVFFKNGKIRRKEDDHHRAVRLAPLMFESDVPMGREIGKNQRFSAHKAGRRQTNSHSYRRVLIESPSGWYRAMIRGGQKYDKWFLLKVIECNLKPHVSLNPIAYTVGQDEISFVVDDYKVAKTLMDADKRITMSDGWQLNIHVRPHAPIVDTSKTEVLSALKAVLAFRYSATPIKALNLSEFHLDKAFEAAGLFIPLNRSTVMTAVLQLIGDSVPDLVALNMSNNRIFSTEEMKIMVEKIPTLKVLHLGNNRLRDIKCLDNLKGVPLSELVLENNPLVDRIKNKDHYVRAVRDRFPKVVKLDNVDLPPPILFVDDEASTLPGSQASFMCDASGTGATVARQFLEQYYQLFDNDRPALSQAYHADAEFSLSLMLSSPSSGTGDNGAPGDRDRRPPPWTDYVPKNRNFMRCRDEQRLRLLSKGSQSIIAMLATLPATTHDPSSFVVDLVIFTPQIIELVVMGVFKEKHRKDAIRSFSRVFLLVPLETGGFCIINEMMSLQNATDDQIRKAFKVDVPPTAAPVPVAAAVVSPATVGGPSLDIQTKQSMVSQLALKTKMNLAWAEKCLNETAWNFDQALYAFSELHAKGAVPAEAFIS